MYGAHSALNIAGALATKAEHLFVAIAVTWIALPAPAALVAPRTITGNVDVFHTLNEQAGSNLP